MTFFLGVDTGGTYTDAVILQDEEKVIASAKALTSRQDLACLLYTSPSPRDRG